MNQRSPHVFNANDGKLEVALYQARIIEQQKQLEAKIVNSIEELLELPTSVEAKPQAPSVTDACHFLRLITIFQPSHYDDLVEERQAAGLCGYVLCPRPPRKVGSDFKLIRGPGKGEVQIVPRNVIERWCSDDCARRALHVKAQLDMEPPWTRSANKEISIKLLDIDFDSPPQKRVNESQGELASVTKSMADLALERGDSTMPWTSRRIVSNSITGRYNGKSESTVSE